jgi:hypothetical protein
MRGHENRTSKPKREQNSHEKQTSSVVRRTPDFGGQVAPISPFSYVGQGHKKRKRGPECIAAKRAEVALSRFAPDPFIASTNGPVIRMTVVLERFLA